MKLAEALLTRADMTQKLLSLRERLKKNAVVQEGDQPHEAPDVLLKEAFAVISGLEKLIQQINAANHQHRMVDGRSLAEAIAQRDHLKQKHSVLQHVIDNSQREPDRYSASEIKWRSVLKVSGLQKQADDISKSIRELNVAIQKENWECEVQP